MIDVTAGKMVFRIKLVFTFILIFGIAIASGIFLFGERISQSTSALVHKDVPIYQQFQNLRNQLTEQERYLYLYYASFNQGHYTNGFQAAQLETRVTLEKLQDHFGNQPALVAILENQQRVLDLAAEFDKNMQLRELNQTDWDLARTQLSDSTLSMRTIAPHIAKLTDIVNGQVVASQKKIDEQLFWVNSFVILYALVSLVIAFLVARSIRAYLDSNALNQRLSLFPKRTPNPIISLDQTNKVTYVNPATRRLLARLGRSVEDSSILLTEELLQFQSEILCSDKHFSQFEYKVEQLTFMCELHWLPDQNQWDLHLTDVSAQALAEAKLNFQAYHHSETCLANQYKFREVLESASSTGSQFTLGIIEIRSFNQLLSAGTFEEIQQVVKEIAAVLDKACHDQQSSIELYHIGDKNFAVRIPDSDCQPTVNSLVKLILQRIRMTSFSGEAQIELDFGFACFPQHGDSIDNIIHHTRIALDASASEEHSDFKLFSDKLGELISRQQSLLHLMRIALQEEVFQLYFQPQYSLVSDALIGAEVLIRWHHEDQWISPAEFIPLAERSGLIMPLGDWILDTACAKAKELIDMGYPDLVIAVNISPKQFAHPNFVENVENVLMKHGLPARNLELEITEGVIFNNEVETIQSLHELKNLGVQLAIDDFGTGYSSLSYLKQFPIDKLKIDQSFVRQMHNNKEDQSIVRTIIDLGVNLRLTLIAEGVEEKEQVGLLKEMGCNEIQGYFYSKPLDEGYFAYFLQSKKSVA